MTRRSSTPTPTSGHAGAVGTKTPTGTHPSRTTVPTAPPINYLRWLACDPTIRLTRVPVAETLFRAHLIEHELKHSR